MRIEDMPPVVHDWPEHAKLTEPESDDMVKLVFGLTEEQHRTKTTETYRDDGARLDTYEASRVRTLSRITDDLDSGLTGAQSAKRGAKSIGLLPMVIDKIDEMIAAGHEALDLIAMLEEDR